jgi:hypothetical protein
LGAKFQRTSSHLVFLNSLLGGLVLAPQGGMTLAQAVKRLRPKQENARNTLLRADLRESEQAFLFILCL